MGNQVTGSVPVHALPAPVRAVIVNWAAETLDRLALPEIPATLIRIARFTPAKRARLGAAALAQAVDADPAFRAAVAERARAALPAAVGVDGDPAGRSADPALPGGDPAGRSADPALPGGDPAGPGGDPAGRSGDRSDPVPAAAMAHLLRLPNEADLLALVTGAQAPIPAAGDPKKLLRQLQRDLKTVTAERDAAISRLPDAGVADDELEKLRRRLREQGTRLRQAEVLSDRSAVRHQDELGAFRREVVRLTEEVTNWQDRAQQATQRADLAQETLGRLRARTGTQKATADRRLDLLLSTVEGAIVGLRREWALTGGGSDPAELVAERMPGAELAPEQTVEPSRLNAWLGLPAAHLIVDGYNVSKTGYPDLTLAQQRDRLVRVLAALAARTSVEVTVVFDGAAVAVPAPPGRGIRVLFSPPGVIADDVIRDLVAAEPIGRVVVVVSSDREVVDGVRRRGARTAGSAVLLALLG